MKVVTDLDEAKNACAVCLNHLSLNEGGHLRKFRGRHGSDCSLNHLSLNEGGHLKRVATTVGQTMKVSITFH